MGQGMMAAEGGWISPNSHSQNNSPRYSPDPGERPTVGGVAGGVASAGVSYPVNSMGMVSVIMVQWSLGYPVSIGPGLKQPDMQSSIITMFFYYIIMKQSNSGANFTLVSSFLRIAFTQITVFSF